MKTRTRAAMEWLENQVKIAKDNDSMTTIHLRENGRMDEETVYNHFSKAGFECKIGNKCVYVTPRGKSHTNKKAE